MMKPGNAILSLIPYYRRFTPRVVKKLMPTTLRSWASKIIYGQTIVLPRAIDSETSKTLAQAIASTKGQVWPVALKCWEIVLEKFSDDEVIAAQARLNISVAKRILNPEQYKKAIIKYNQDRQFRPGSQKKIALYTAIVGKYDSIKLPEKLDPRIDYFLFTDTPAPETGIWQIRPITYHDSDPVRTARYIKTHPHTLLSDYDIAIWLDANVMIVEEISVLIDRFISSEQAVGAIPHPYRDTITEEYHACKKLNKDDVRALKRQLDFYKMEGFETSSLLESGLIFLDLKNPLTEDFLNCWWSQIDTFSRRDQISLPYALHTAGVSTFHITERPNNLRTLPEFVFLQHDGNSRSEQLLIEALGFDMVSPDQREPYASQKAERLLAQADRSIDIVICVHNALEDVRACLTSVEEHRKSDNQRVIIVDDGSEAATAEYLKQFAAQHGWCDLLRNEEPVRYTRAANQGLLASTAELVILLNSDTLVTENWAIKLADAVFSCPAGGIVGPLSNAASHQSIPDQRGTHNQTAINQLPEGITKDHMNRLCEEWSKLDLLPSVPLVHGFCFGITRAVIDTIGLLDEETFPRGFGEENDYCFRAIDAGFQLVIATHCYVYHSKSKSYGTDFRKEIAEKSYKSLIEKHGASRVERAVKAMDKHPLLQDLRTKAQSVYSHPVGLDTKTGNC